MSTATGDFAIDWSAAANSNPYTNSNFTLIDTGLDFQILSNALLADAADGLRRWFYNGASGAVSGSAILRSKVEIKNANVSDVLMPSLLKSDGSGYVLQINTTFWGIKTIDAAGATGGLISDTAATSANGDVAMLELNQTTHTLTAYLNGTQVGAMTVTDSTYTTGLAPSIAIDAGNNNTSTIRSWAGDGIVVAASNLPQSWDRQGAMGVMVAM